MLEEYLDILDATGNFTGQTKPRSAVHRDGDWHRAVNIWIVNPELGILLQRRAPDKDSWPGYWDISCGGHLVAGDSSIRGAIRELREELDLVINPSDLEFLITTPSSTRPSPSFINNSFNDLYLLKTEKNLTDFRRQASEISDLKFVSLPELETMLNSDPSPLVPHPEFYRIIIDIMQKM